jgi:hypothetical protein
MCTYSDHTKKINLGFGFTMAGRSRSNRNMRNYSLLLFVILLSVSLCLSSGVVHAAADEDTAETQTCDAGTTDSNGACSAMDAPNADAAPDADKTKSSGGKKKYPECGLYLAESTIPNAGVGIFTAVAKKPDDLLGSGDVVIPNIDIKYHNDIFLKMHGQIFDPLKAYYWSGFLMGMLRESNANDVEAYCPGLDCAINCNLALINTQKSEPLYDNSGLHRARDPGAGAFTPYHNGTTLASRHIPVGGELFKYYGSSWFSTRPLIFDGNFPLLADYAVAEELLRNMTAIKLDADIRKDLYEDIVVSMKDAFTSRTLGALPLTVEDAVTAAEQEIAVLHQPTATRSIEWLQEHGRCIDNIEGRYSTIRQAARGAFATRSLTKDQVITTSPLHHLPTNRFVEKYHFKDLPNEKGELVRTPVSMMGYQVLLNYCYGHANSSMLLCPYGNGVNYINHNQTQANVKIRWAQDFDIVHNATVVETEPVDVLWWNMKPQLAFDYVALRDIQEGEELFLDYGDGFEAAWQRHVANYKPPPEWNNFVEGMTINTKFYNIQIRTEKEQQATPYPEHLQIRVHGLLETVPDLKDGMYLWTVNDYGLPVRILERHVSATEHTYDVEMALVPMDNYSDKHTRNREANLEWVRRYRVPRSAIVFYDKPGTSDMHLPSAFRHMIGIPGEIFPKQWENLPVPVPVEA